VVIAPPDEVLSVAEVTGLVESSANGSRYRTAFTGYFRFDEFPRRDIV